MPTVTVDIIGNYSVEKIQKITFSVEINLLLLYKIYYNTKIIF